MHIHLNPLGGVAGDMFIAAILDAWPEHRVDLVAAIRAAGLCESVRIEVDAHRDHALTGTRFSVVGAQFEREHTRFRDIRARLTGSALAGPVRERAIDIFTRLARAESRVHGVALEEVSFHEVGAEDSVADVVGAAHLAETLRASWSCDALPMGRGRVKTAHGELPLPAPAVAHLLDGLPCFQDEQVGERITPTGAAILRHLEPSFEPMRVPMHLARNGIGFGTSSFPGISNVLRVLAFEPARDDVQHEQVGVLHFEVDDQTPEDLALGLDRLRRRSSVLDVTQIPAYGKKGRLCMQIQVLVEPGALHEVATACLSETSTLGVRGQLTARFLLERRAHHFGHGADAVSVKTAQRPSGARTAKSEADDVVEAGDYAARQRRRREAEDSVLAKPVEDGD